MCEPVMIAGSFGSLPSRRPMMFPAVSTRTSRPASRIRPVMYSRPAMSAALNATRLTPPSGFVPNFDSSAMRCCRRSDLAGGSPGAATTASDAARPRRARKAGRARVGTMRHLEGGVPHLSAVLLPILAQYQPVLGQLLVALEAILGLEIGDRLRGGLHEALE